MITVRRAGRLVCAFPLCEEQSSPREFGTIRLRSIANSHSFRSHYLLEPGEEGALDALFDYLRRRPRRWHFLEISDAPVDDELRSLLLRADGQGLPGALWTAYESSYVRTSGDWAGYEKQLGRSMRKGLRRRRRRLDEESPVAFELTRGTETLDADLADLYRLEGSGWKAEAGSTIECSPVLRAYYRDIARWAADSGMLRLSFLRTGDRRIAADISLLHGRHLFSMKTGYDPDYAQFSPGRLLTLDLLQRCFEGGFGAIDEVDFLGATDVGVWSDHSRAVGWGYVYNRRVRSRLHRALKFTLRRRGREYASLPD